MNIGEIQRIIEVEDPEATPPIVEPAAPTPATPVETPAEEPVGV